MRHAQVAYFEPGGRPVAPADVPLTQEGREQARAAAVALAGIAFDRVVTSGLPRTVETARIVAPDAEVESWPELRELESGRIRDIPEDDLEAAFTGAFRGDVPLETRFLGGEMVGSLLDRVSPALDRLLADETWDVLLGVLHGGVNRAVLSRALTGERRFLGGFEQAPACINVLDVGADWIVRAVNYAPYDPVHARGRATTMEELYDEYLPYRKARAR
ncbi:MAG: histidine phosphatase family protein [Gaiellaceae bacterium]